MAFNPAPNASMIDSARTLQDEVEKRYQHWYSTSLSTADPEATDLDGYVKPLITIAELLRKLRMPDVSRQVYQSAIDAVNKKCDDDNVDLHRGAIYANYAIAQFEIGRYTQALSWLHAAASEDMRHRSDITEISESYAFSDHGIFGQWLRHEFMPKLPADVAPFVSSTVGVAISEQDIVSVVRWLAGRGDLNLFSGVVEYASVGVATDYHAQTVRLTCVRDLATLFETLLKLLGRAHKDLDVAAKFVSPGTVAGIICHDHFGTRKNVRRQRPTTAWPLQSGLLYNSVATWPDLVFTIDSAIDQCASQPCDQVLADLKGTTLCGDAATDVMAKRLLMSYRLRNETSHNLNPTDPAMADHYDEYRLWLLQAIFTTFSWARKTAAVTF